MTHQRLRVHIMTAALSPGDAVSNFVLNLARLFRKWGAKPYVYADHIAPQLQTAARHSSLYQPTGEDLLWFHYSIYADNVQRALESPDFKVLDYHGISPPHLFAGHNVHLENLCRQGLELLPQLSQRFDHSIVHSEDSRRVLLSHGFPAGQISKIYLSTDTTKFENARDPSLSALLSQVDYLLMVGRIVPQKDVGALIDIFAHLHAQRPDLFAILAGTRDQTKRYQADLERQIAARGVAGRVYFTDQINNPAVLRALYENARLLVVTSEWESFCVPIAEALHFNVPVATHDQEPMVEIAGPAAVVFDKHRPADAAGMIMSLLDDPVRYAELKEEAGRWARRYNDMSLESNILAFLRQRFDQTPA